MSDYPIKLSEKRWVFEKVTIGENSVKFLDQDEFAYCYLILEELAKRKTFKSAFQVTLFLRDLHKSGGKYDQQTFRYLYFMAGRKPPLLVLEEKYDPTTGGGGTRIITKPTLAGLKWLLQNRELAAQASELNARLKN